MSLQRFRVNSVVTTDGVVRHAGATAFWRFATPWVRTSRYDSCWGLIGSAG